MNIVDAVVLSVESSIEGRLPLGPFGPARRPKKRIARLPTGERPLAVPTRRISATAV